MIVKNNKDKIYVGLFLAVVCIVMLAFFIGEYPATLFNTDDWCFITDTRGAYPIWGALNPCRVLPEVLMPFATWLAMHFVYPVLKDIVMSITVMSGIFMSAAITFYAFTAYRAIKNIFKLECAPSALLAAIFIIFHFLAFRKFNTGSAFAFEASSLTHIYFYALPNILNAALVLLFMGGRPQKHKGILLVLVYIALLSNLFASIALPAYIASVMLLDFIKRRKEFKSFLKDNVENIAILMFWLLVQIFEINGGRAASISVSEPILGLVISKAKSFFSMLYHDINHLFLFFSVICCIIAFVIMLRKKDKETSGLFIVDIIALAVTFVYILLVAARSSGWITYFGVFYEIFLFAVILVIMALGYVMKNFHKLQILLPLMCLIFIVEGSTSGETYKAACQVSTESARALDKYIIESVVEADKEGKDYLKLPVPYFGGYDNFPLADYGGGSVAGFLNKYGFISKYIYVEFAPDESLNEEFNIEW